MLKFYVKASEALKSFRDDQAGVVSFEYILVATCVVIAVAAAFGTSTGGALQTSLSDALSNMLDRFDTATAAPAAP